MKNILETIKTDDVVAVRFDYSAITGKPMLCVDTYDEEEIQHYLDDSFKIHECNEFLRSLNLTEAEQIFFSTYQEYAYKVKYINNLLEIKKLSEQITGKKYDDIGISANKIHSYILDTLLVRHRMAMKNYESATSVLEGRPLDEWVSEAIADLT